MVMVPTRTPMEIFTVASGPMTRSTDRVFTPSRPSPVNMWEHSTRDSWSRAAPTDWQMGQHILEVCFYGSIMSAFFFLLFSRLVTLLLTCQPGLTDLTQQSYLDVIVSCCFSDLLHQAGKKTAQMVQENGLSHMAQSRVAMPRCRPPRSPKTPMSLGNLRNPGFIIQNIIFQAVKTNGKWACRHVSLHITIGEQGATPFFFQGGARRSQMHQHMSNTTDLFFF